MSLSAKKIEVFSGTGGVGKTTLATSRAIALARQNKTVLLITIDPAKRLKQLLKINEHNSGQNIQVKDPLSLNEELNLFVQLMNPQQTLLKVAHKENSSELRENRILKILSKPFGGLNEILASLELQLNLESDQYEHIILDTPPGSHFIDFLKSIDKIKSFFNQQFIDIFKVLGKSSSTSDFSAGRKIVSLVLSTGVKKLLDQLKKVTGEQFVNDFMDAIGVIYSSKNAFFKALEVKEVLKDESFTQWYLVTSVEHSKTDEAVELQSSAKSLLESKTIVLINKNLSHLLEEWSPQSKIEKELKTSFSYKESSLQSKMREIFEQVYSFSEVIKASPQDHLLSLSSQWEDLSRSTHAKV